jgi:hypothetical protein
MTIRAVAISLAFACTLAACASGNLGTGAEPIDVIDEATLPTVEQLIAPTPAMRTAALSGDPVQMAEAVAMLSSCQSPSTCPAEFGACTNWSPNNECNAFCEFSPICRCANPVFAPGEGDESNLRECGPEDTEFGFRRFFDSFRVCFNPQQEACTEWRQTTTRSGCNCVE